MKEFSEFENPEKKDYDLTSNDGVIKSIMMEKYKYLKYNMIS